MKIFPLVDLISPFSSSMASIMTRHMQLIKMAKWLNFLVQPDQRTRAAIVEVHEDPDVSVVLSELQDWRYDSGNTAFYLF